ncbi:MAG: collagenase [Chlamydiae bacterium SM23_39]|nr:MAG: collagenase [Chlamydiae bacterium SM23_39]
MKKIELSAPVGDFPSLIAAIKSKADSIYFGIEHLNMRNSSKNFSITDISEISKYCKKNHVRAYITLNTLIYDKDLSLMKKICDVAKKEKIDSIIASDLSVIQYANKIKLKVHISTQQNISNIESIKFFSKYADVIVLARELDLTQIKQISNTIKKEKIYGPSKKPLKIEIFIHGAMCVAIAGRCYMSLMQYNLSSNRGKCLQPCRRRYKVTDEETGKELIIDNKYVMSPKDLCTISFLDKIIESGVDILKIEGRARSPEYVQTVVSTYKKAILSIKEKKFSKDKIKKWIDSLKTVYNRGFWEGYYLRKKTDAWSSCYGSKASYKKKYIGKITNYFSKIKIVELLLEAGRLKKNDDILIIGNSTGVVKHKLKNFITHTDNIITFPINKKIKKNDKLYLIKKR